MDHKIAIMDLCAGGAGADTAMKPLMLQPILFCPVVRWVCQELMDCGVGRFFLICAAPWREETAGVLAELEAETLFFDTPEAALSAAEGDVVIVPAPVVPVWGQEGRTVYAADAALLRAVAGEALRDLLRKLPADLRAAARLDEAEGLLELLDEVNADLLARLAGEEGGE